MFGAQAEEQPHWVKPRRHPSPFGPIIVSIAGAFIWLFFILFFAVFWSKGYSLFQDIVIFVATLFITALAIGVVWLVWGRHQWRWWTR